MRKNLRRLTPRHLKMIECLSRGGMTQKEVSKQFGISQTWLSLLRKDPLWRAKEAEYKEHIQQTWEINILSMVPDALDALREALYSSVQSIRIKAAKEILKRGGIDGKSSNEAKGSIFIDMYKPKLMKGKNDAVEVRNCQKKDSEGEIG